MRVHAILLTTLILVSCSKAAQSPAQADYAAGAAVDAVAEAPAADATAAPRSAPAETQAKAAGPQSPAMSPAPGGPTAPMLAYSYDYRISAPPKGVRSLVARHETACLAAGPAVCQVTASNVAEQGKGEVQGTLSLRAEPGWLRKFRVGLEKQAGEAGGEVMSSGAVSEDLTRQLVDTEAAIRAKTTLRDRLQGHLASRPGKLSELLELEQALAQVQQELDATQSELAVMRTRVATSTLTINYASTGIAGEPGAWRPLTEALGDIGAMLAGSLGMLVRLVVTALPWVLALGGVWFLVRGRLPKLRRRSVAANPEKAP